jgi:uncharacterized membrane protein
MKTFNGKDLSVRKAFSRVFTVINLIAGELLSSRAHVLLRLITQI